MLELLGQRAHGEERLVNGVRPPGLRLLLAGNASRAVLSRWVSGLTAPPRAWGACYTASYTLFILFGAEVIQASYLNYSVAHGTSGPWLHCFPWDGTQRHCSNLAPDGEH